MCQQWQEQWHSSQGHVSKNLTLTVGQFLPGQQFFPTAGPLQDPAKHLAANIYSQATQTKLRAKGRANASSIPRRLPMAVQRPQERVPLKATPHGADRLFFVPGLEKTSKHFANWKMDENGPSRNSGFPQKCWCSIVFWCFLYVYQRVDSSFTPCALELSTANCAPWILKPWASVHSHQCHNPFGHLSSEACTQ